MNAIDSKPDNYSKSDCIRCYKCSSLCPESSLEFTFFDKSKENFQPDKIKLSWKYLLTLVAGVTALLIDRSGFSAAPGRMSLRPPGTVEEDLLSDLCIRCGSCIRICPSGTLSSANFGFGLRHVLTPELVPRQGGCLYDCNACGSVCPTGAIKNFTLDKKRKIKIGLAKIDSSRCLPMKDGKQCLACFASCPLEAIILKETDKRTKWGDSLLIPVIDKKKCTGCGLCEAACIVKGEAAVSIFLPVTYAQSGQTKGIDKRRDEQSGE